MKPVELMYADHTGVLEYLRSQHQPSYHATLQTTLPKVLLLAAASEFEDRVCETLREYVREHIIDLKIFELVDQKAINRHYHSLFNWDVKNINKFWSLFGAGFKSGIIDYCKKDPLLSAQIIAFMEIGSLRNQMVHNNYASFPLDKTLDEVYDLYVEADRFVAKLPELLRLNFGISP